MKKLIYSIEDDKDISHLISLILSKQDYEVVSFYNGESFLNEFSKRKPDLILLDLMLPDISGEDLLKRIRNDEKNNDIEIIIVSAKNSLLNKVDLLDLGADDFISKPFEVLELISRVNARIRRHKISNILTYRDLTIYVSKNEIYRDNTLINLTKNEFQIFLYLFKHLDKVVSRDELFEYLWGNNGNYESRVIDVHIKEIRKKLNDSKYHYISSVYGEGYKLIEE